MNGTEIQHPYCILWDCFFFFLLLSMDTCQAEGEGDENLEKAVIGNIFFSRKSSILLLYSLPQSFHELFLQAREVKVCLGIRASACMDI